MSRSNHCGATFGTVVRGDKAKPRGEVLARLQAKFQAVAYSADRKETA
jgi:hypothetical protein